MTNFSFLDLAPIAQGSSARDALRNSLDMIRHAEQWGMKRYWVAEHHNMPGIASSATAVVIGHLAGGTSTIRVGAGGVMLPNHAPLIIAEQFGTLATLYPGRIDLGLGRAPGTDQMTARALRRTLTGNEDDFPSDIRELQQYFADPRPGQAITATPGAGTKVPLWILGSSLYGAQLAAAMGLPYSFASHFAPEAMMQAIAIYRERFQPSQQLKEPYVMLGYNAVAADTDEQAQYLQTSVLQWFIKLRTGNPGLLPPPVRDFEATLSPVGRQLVDGLLRQKVSAIGSLNTVKSSMEEFIERTGADELIITSSVYDHFSRLRSLEIITEAARSISAEQSS